MSLALVTLSLLTAPSAQAQYNGGYPGSGGSPSPTHCWAITYTQTGAWISGARDHPTFGQATGQSTAWPISYNPNYGGFFGGSSTSINNVMQGTVTATLTWVPATGQTLATDPPAEPVYIAESAIATDTPSWGGMGSAPMGQGTVSDGLGDPWVVNGTGRTASGTHIITQDGTSGSIVLTDTLFALTPASTFTPYPPPGYGGGTWDWTAGGCTVTFSVAIDTRAVTISADVDDSAPTFYKVLAGGLDANGDGLVARIQHKRDPDGTMKGDIGIPYGEEHTETDTDYFGNVTHKHVETPTIFTVTYKAHLSGNWATWMSNFLWNSSLKNYSFDGSLYHLSGIGLPTEDDIPVLKNVYNGPMIDNDNGGAIITNEAGFNGTTDHLFFKFQNGDNRPNYPTGNDGDGAIATANYYMTLHQPDELFSSNKHGILQTGYNLPENAFLRDMPVNADSPQYATYGNSIGCTWNAPGAFWGDLAGAVGVGEHLPLEEYPWLPAMLALAHVGLEQIADEGDHQGVTFTVGPSDPNAAPSPWDDPASSIDQTIPITSTTDKSLYHFYPLGVHILYKKVYGLIDQYDQTGFTGESQATPLNICEGAYSFFGHFKYTFQ